MKRAMTFALLFFSVILVVFISFDASTYDTPPDEALTQAEIDQLRTLQDAGLRRYGEASKRDSAARVDGKRVHKKVMDGFGIFAEETVEGNDEYAYDAKNSFIGGEKENVFIPPEKKTVERKPASLNKKRASKSRANKKATGKQLKSKAKAAVAPVQQSYEKTFFELEEKKQSVYQAVDSQNSSSSK